jgi:hypothetical protein
VSAGRTARKERWSIDAGTADVAQLEVPADGNRERTFEVTCELVVVRDAAGAAGDAWHSLRVTADGALQWERRVTTHDHGPDTLEVGFRRTVPLGQLLRLNAVGEVHRGRRLRLVVSAEEE